MRLWLIINILFLFLLPLNTLNAKGSFAGDIGLVGTKANNFNGAVVETYINTYMQSNGFGKIDGEVGRTDSLTQGDDISKVLSSNVNSEEIERLTKSTSTIEYMSIVLSSLRSIQDTMQKDDFDDIDILIKQVQFYMFAWTAPMEIISTRNIYSSSFLGMSDSLYKNLRKGIYVNYNKYIHTLIFTNLVENVLIKDVIKSSGTFYFIDNSFIIDSDIFNDKITKIDYQSTGVVTQLMLGSTAIITPAEKEDLDSICSYIVKLGDFNQRLLLYLGSNDTNVAREFINNSISSILDKSSIESQLEELSGKKLSHNGSVIFDGDIETHKGVSVNTIFLNDDWYFMIRDYMQIQDSFYQSKKEIEKIIKILVDMPGYEKEVAILKNSLIHVDSLYRKLDEIVRYNIIDVPISVYSDIYNIKFNEAKGWINDNEAVMSEIAVAYNKSCANIQRYVATESIKEKLVSITKRFKSEFDADEWEEIKSRAKLTQDWFNMLNKIKVQNE